MRTNSALPYFVATFEGSAVTIKRDADYNTVIKYVQKSIPQLQSADTQDIFISTKLAEYGDIIVRISEETWSDVVDDVKSAEITLSPTARARNQAATAAVTNPIAQAASPPVLPSRNLGGDLLGTASPCTQLQAPSNPVMTTLDATSSRFSVKLRTTCGTEYRLDGIHRSSSIRSLKAQLEHQSGIPAALIRLKLLGNFLDDDQMLGQASITAGTTIDLILNTRKSAIYCLAPRRDTPEKFTLNNVQVNLWLDRIWELVAVGSSNNTESKDFHQTKSWTINVAEDATVWEPYFQKESECLFWDGMYGALVCAPPLSGKT
ncbi:hypothetical protein FRC07_001310 [Ceratobasidium sp. 392]|nr:hypothetical protein FRC07_001310 [Ceratobasidium sp. 392]